ncbi:MAG: hypothetical protein ACRCXE_02635, partial [Metamycoplasmataceae bacterium]
KMKDKKIWLWLLFPIIFFGAMFTGAIYKTINPYKPTIYNYQSYVNPDLIPEIEKNYSYREYKLNSEFNNAIDNNKAIAGISSDYMLIELINTNKISKINFVEAFGVEDPTIFYSDATNKQLQFFDKFIAPNAKVKGDVDGDGIVDHLSEYIIPIWINNKVFVYNSDKINGNVPDFTGNDFSHESILKELKRSGVDVWSWVNAPIENSVIGSELDVFDTTLTNDNYIKRIDEFAQIVKNGTGHEISDFATNIFEGDSDVVLQSTIDPKSFIQGSYLFNGDALDAYWSEDNFSNVPTGTIKLVKPRNSLSFVDGFVVSSSISEKNHIELLQNLNPVFFEGKFMTKEEIALEVTLDDGTIDWELLASLSNFDYVNFTPTSKGEYEFVLENYFVDEEEPGIAEAFYTIEAYQITPIVPVNEELQSRIAIEFRRRLRM